MRSKTVPLFILLQILASCDSSSSSTDVGADVDTDNNPDSLSDGSDATAGCGRAKIETNDEGIVVIDDCGTVYVQLLPSLLVDGVWVGGVSGADCEAESSSLTCAFGVGTVVVEVDGAELTLELTADQSFELGGFSLEGVARIEGATAWLSNGFQSWSQSGVLSLGELADEEELQEALEARGDAEVMREGSELSCWYTYIGGGETSLLVGALTAERFRAWVQVGHGGDDELWDDELYLRMAAGGAGESVAVNAGDSISGESWQLELGSDLHGMLERYAEALPSRRDEVEVEAELGWNSWYELWDSVDEESVRANAALARETYGDRIPAGAPPIRIVVDDGWQVMWGEWEPNQKFPSGLDGLAADLSGDGFTMGIWLAPLLVHGDSELVEEHPEWFVDGAQFRHLEEGRMRILDVTHPEAAAHLAGVVERLVGWGYGLLKIDFLFAGTFEGDRHEDVTGLEAYRLALEIIREAAGEETLLLAVGAPALPSLPYVDSWRVGPDIALSVFGAVWPGIPAEARTIASRYHICLATLCDGDPPLLRDLPRNEVEASVWVAAFAGGAFFLSDDLRLLPEERRSWGLDEARLNLGIGGLPAEPEDHFPEEAPVILGSSAADLVLDSSSAVLPLVWRTPEGARVALNPGEESIEVEGVEVEARSAVVLP